MPRIVHLEPHLTSDKLHARCKDATHPREARHWQMLWLLSLGHRLDFAASVAGNSHSNAGNILKKYDLHGPDSLKDRRTQGTHTPRTPLLSSAQQ